MAGDREVGSGRVGVLCAMKARVVVGRGGVIVDSSCRGVVVWKHWV